MKLNKKQFIVVKMCLFMFTCLFIGACSQTEKYETIEIYMTETYDDHQNDEDDSKMLLTEDANTLKEEIQEPSTILITADNAKDYKANNMTDEEKAEVKEHILTLMEKL